MTGVEATGMPIGDIITQFGFAGLIFIAFMFLLKWVLKHQDNILINQIKILDDAKLERVAWQTLFSSLKDCITSHVESTKADILQFKEADRFQREEHDKMLEQHQNMIDTLVNINQALQKCQANLEEQGKTLARLNGFHK